MEGYAWTDVVDVTAKRDFRTLTIEKAAQNNVFHSIFDKYALRKSLQVVLS